MSTIQCLKCGSQSFTSMVKVPVEFPGEVKFIQCTGCGGIIGVEEVNNWMAETDSDYIDQEQKPGSSSPTSQSIHPPDISTILKRLYG
jgi:hypothetical protein